VAVLNDILSITISSGFTGSQADQAFFYKFISGGSGSASDLSIEFRDEVVPAIADILQEDQPIFHARTVNLFNDSDWNDYPISPAIMGTRAGQALPSINVAGFKSAKPSSSQAPARKRFGSLSESDVQGNGLQDVTGYFDALDALAVILGEDMVTGTGNTYSPVIVKRIAYTTTGGKIAYRLPGSQSESVSLPAINWTWDNVVTTQVTRKPGRGI